MSLTNFEDFVVEKISKCVFFVDQGFDKE